MPEMINLSKKVLLLGDPAVGKTSLIRKFVYDMFDDNYISTLGAKVSRKRMMFDHPSNKGQIEMKMMIWDVMGQKEYGMLHRSAYQGSQGALIVCDTLRRKTFENLTSWISGLFNITGQIPIILIGNKCDIFEGRQISIEDLNETGSTFTAPTFFASALTGENVELSFSILGNNMITIDINQNQI
jgi:small GTP-binding protein